MEANVCRQELSPFWLILGTGPCTPGQQAMLLLSRDVQGPRSPALCAVHHSPEVRGSSETDRFLMNTGMEIYNRLETTHIMTSSVWMQMCGRSGSKTKAAFPLRGELFFNPTGPPHWSLLSTHWEAICLFTLGPLSSSSLCSGSLTSPALANP